MGVTGTTSKDVGEPAARERVGVWRITAVIAALLVVLHATLLLDDETFTWLIREDHPIELFGSLALLATAVFCFMAWRRARHWPWLPRLCLLVFSVLFLFGVGEEVSWGQRIVGLETPEEVERVNAQGELNVHNLEFFSGFLDPDRLFQLFWLLFGVIVPLAALHVRARQRLARLVPILAAPLAVAFVLNQALTKAFHALLTARPELYHATVHPLNHAVFEIKETGVAIIFACGFWLLLRSLGTDRDMVMSATRDPTGRRPNS